MIKSMPADGNAHAQAIDRSLPTATTLPIVETFHSIQGEGAWTGTNAFFIRLAGCDVGCPFCDTKISWNSRRHPDRPISELVAEAIAAQPQFVVITGGEPLMHDLTSLTTQLHQSGLRIHLETSGAHSLRGAFDWITLSPKRFKPPLAGIHAGVHELKIVVSDAIDLEWAELQAAYVPTGVIKYLQPEWDSPSSTALIFDYILQHPEWRLSLQTHKFLGVR